MGATTTDNKTGLQFSPVSPMVIFGPVDWTLKYYQYHHKDCLAHAAKLGEECPSSWCWVTPGHAASAHITRGNSHGKMMDLIHHSQT